MSYKGILEDDSILLLKKILREAYKDGRLTDDEKAIIDIIHNELMAMEQSIRLLLKSEITTPEMVEELNKMLTRALDQAKEVANEDDVITEEEGNLLKMFEDYIRSGSVSVLLMEFINKLL